MVNQVTGRYNELKKVKSSERQDDKSLSAFARSHNFNPHILLKVDVDIDYCPIIVAR